MSFPVSGQIAMSDVNIKLGRSSNTQIDFSTIRTSGFSGGNAGSIDLVNPVKMSFLYGSSPSGKALLNGITIPSPILAAGVQWLIPDYTGPIFRVQRSIDNAQTDVWTNNVGSVVKITSNGATDSNALNTWANGSTMRVVTLYDQSGNNRHLVNTNTTYGNNITYTGPVYDPTNKRIMFSSNALIYDFGADTSFTAMQVLSRAQLNNDVNTNQWRKFIACASSNITEYGWNTITSTGGWTSTFNMLLADNRTTGFTANGFGIQRANYDTGVSSDNSLVKNIRTFDLGIDTTTTPDTHSLFIDGSFRHTPFSTATVDNGLVIRFIQLGARAYHALPLTTLQEPINALVYNIMFFDIVLSNSTRSSIGAALGQLT